MPSPARHLLALALIATPAAAQDPTTWRLVSLNGADFAARATLSYLPDGTLQGEGPCNSYGGQLTALPPAWALGPVRATRMACDALDAETVFFNALSAMTAADATADTLTLTAPDGSTMVFTASGG
ncbi:MAG: META domain-containing protein [Rhodobacteraceae bacterium]|nr:META domain-containing protein [Paracoccaceae bacterium]